MTNRELPAGSGRVITGICIALVAITWLVFGQTLGHEFINHDDPDYVYQNPHVTDGLTAAGIRWAFAHSHSNNWHPLTWISHMLDVQMFGLNAGGHHFVNVLLHTIAVLLLFFVLREMTGDLWPSGVVAALFAIHPLHVESVAWIAERKDVLSGVFFLLTLGAYLRYVREQTPGRYMAMSILFVMGLMSKPMLVTLPLVLLLLDYWPLGRGSGAKKLILEKVPLLALSAASCVVTLLVQKDAINSLGQLPLMLRIGNAVASSMLYIRQMLWPASLTPLYPPVEGHWPIWEISVAGALLVAISVASYAFRNNRPSLFTGWWWYLGMLVPVIGLVQVGLQAHADRYTYLPQIGLYIALAWGSVDLTNSWKHQRQILSVATMLVLGALIWRATVQASHWRDSESLWRYTLVTTPHNVLAHYNLGNALIQKGDLDGAITQYRCALASPFVYTTEAHHGLGEALLRKGQMDEAALEFEKVIAIWPDDAEAHNNLGGVLLGKGNVDEAIIHFQKALEKQPDNAKAHNNLGNALLQKGRIDEAIVHYRKGLELPFDRATAHYNMGNALLRRGDIDEAIAHYRKAVELNPAHANAHNNLANVLRHTGLLNEAMVHYEQAFELDRRSILFQNNLAWVLATSPEESIRNGARAVELSEQANQMSGGEDPTILRTLAAAYAENGQFSQAIATAQRALELAEAQNNGALSESLRQEITLYQAGSPFHEPGR